MLFFFLLFKRCITYKKEIQISSTALHNYLCIYLCDHRLGLAHLQCSRRLPPKETPTLTSARVHRVGTGPFVPYDLEGWSSVCASCKKLGETEAEAEAETERGRGWAMAEQFLPLKFTMLTKSLQAPLGRTEGGLQFGQGAMLIDHPSQGGRYQLWRSPPPT